MRQHDILTALHHLCTARRLLRDAYAIKATVAVNKAIRLTEQLVARPRPEQPSFDLEAADQPPVE